MISFWNRTNRQLSVKNRVANIFHKLFINVTGELKLKADEKTNK